MAEITQFKSAVQLCGESAIETLEDALAEAKEGKIHCVGIAFVRPDGGINSTHSDSNDIGRLLGAVALMNHRLLSGCDQGD